MLQINLYRATFILHIAQYGTTQYQSKLTEEMMCSTSTDCLASDDNVLHTISSTTASSQDSLNKTSIQHQQLALAKEELHQKSKLALLECSRAVTNAFCIGGATSVFLAGYIAQSECYTTSITQAMCCGILSSATYYYYKYCDCIGKCVAEIHSAADFVQELEALSTDYD